MLDSSAFTYESFIDNRIKSRPGFTVGTSGQLLLATHKDDGKKYLVKHTYPHNAANEYVECWLAEKLDTPAPRAYLLSPNKVFKSKYAVAIQYVARVELDPEAEAELNRRLDILHNLTWNSRMAKANHVMVTVTFFVPCSDEQNFAYGVAGSYKEVTGILLNVDSEITRTIYLRTSSGKRTISFEDVLDIDCAAGVFNRDWIPEIP